MEIKWNIQQTAVTFIMMYCKALLGNWSFWFRFQFQIKIVLFVIYYGNLYSLRGVYCVSPYLKNLSIDAITFYPQICKESNIYQYSVSKKRYHWLDFMSFIQYAVSNREMGGIWRYCMRRFCDAVLHWTQFFTFKFALFLFSHLFLYLFKF